MSLSGLPPPPRMDKDLASHSWQDWFFKLWKAIDGMGIDLNYLATGGYPGKTPFYVYGRNSDVDATTEAVWRGPLGAGGAYVFPTTPIQMQVVSTSANDDGAPVGTGARTVEIHYLDTNYATQTHTFTMNGINAVTSTPTDILRVNDFYVTSVGSTGNAEGAISLQSVGGATTYGYIPAGENNSPQAVYTVPANKTAYITWWDVSAGVDTGNHYTRFTFTADVTHDGVRNAGVMVEQDSLGVLNGSANTQGTPPFRIPEKVDIVIKVVSDAAGANVDATTHFHGWLE